MNDLYSVLGVARDSEQASIRKAFKKLARELHPDVNKDPAAQERFKQVTAAYEVLGDEQRRALYDEFGEASLRAGFDADAARAWKSAGGGAAGGGFPGGGFPGGFPGNGGGFGFDDLFSGLFSRGYGGGQARGPQRGADVEGRVSVPFLEAVRGGKVPVHVRLPAACTMCKGEGGHGRTSCGACSGRGRRTVRQFGMDAQVQCEQCGGAGSTFAEECARCGGTGRVRDLRTIHVSVPAGIESGKQLRLRGQGGEGQRGGPPGDLILAIDVEPHPLLRRIGNDLELDLPLSLSEALGGATVEVPTPTGRLRVKVPAGAQNGRKMRIPGRGVQGSPPGDLYLVLRPMLPTSSSDDALRLARELEALGGSVDVRADFAL
jgi:molecular chaperone DnaJ